ncbi:MAG: hypothetical protein HKN23_13830 [Verrucomicrobiales bacterium]|nr:hypothetical protein [Verrucomicrobiales bacterium]
MVNAEPPGASYVFPAGAQRGTEIETRVGGFYFHGEAKFHRVDAAGWTVSPTVTEIDTTWFEGPMIFQPDSQKPEDYPKDYLAKIAIAGDAKLGVREWFCETDQGTTPNLKFVIGVYPEIVEREIDGAPVPEEIASLPVTINGRIFPREDVDVWEFVANAGEPIVCEIAAKQLENPLEPVLKITGPDGHAIKTGTRLRRGDPVVSFVTSEAGKYKIQITDANFWGLQNYVYRLTVRRGLPVVGYFPVRGEAGKITNVGFQFGNGSIKTVPVTMPEESGFVPVDLGDHVAVVPFHVAQPGDRIFDGEIDEPGKTNRYPIELAEGEMIAAAIFAHDFDSRLDSLVTIEDEEGRQLYQNDDRADKQPDSRAVFTAKKAGKFFVKVGDKFASRGGPGFGYRLKLSPVTEPIDFELKIAPTPINIHRLTKAAAALEEKPKPVRGTGLAVDLIAIGPLKSDIELSVEGLPDGVALTGTKLQYRRKKTEVFFEAQPDTPLTSTEITLVGTADLGDGQILTRRAKFPVRFTVAPAVPFKHSGQYWITNDHPCGSVLVKRYRVERFDGFDGTVRAMLSDRQIRHLQGVTAPIVEVPAGVSEFEFPITFPPSMELGRTSRVQLMLVGEVDGKTVSFTTRERNEQMITITTDGLLNLSTPSPTIAVAPGELVSLPVSIKRDNSLSGRPVRLEAVIPPHFKGISAKPVEIGGSESEAVVTLDFSPGAVGPFNQPLQILATTTDAKGAPFTAETKVELVRTE